MPNVSITINKSKSPGNTPGYDANQMVQNATHNSYPAIWKTIQKVHGGENVCGTGAKSGQRAASQTT